MSDADDRSPEAPDEGGEISVQPTSGSHIAIVFDGPNSCRMVYTRKGVTSAMLSAAAAMLTAMANIELEGAHVTTLQQMENRRRMSSIAVPGGSKPRGH